MKKVTSLLTVVALGAALVLSGCNNQASTPATATDNTAQQTATEGKYKDGIYFAQQPEFANGWKYT